MFNPLATRSETPDKRRGVREICASLGYRSNDRSEPRNYITLRDKVILYRKEYVEKQSELRQTEVIFPTSHQTRVARECASDFLRENKHLFRESSVPSDNERLIYPESSQKILVELAKMMCMQALKYNSRSARKTNCHRSESQEVDLSNTPENVDKHGSNQNVYQREYINSRPGPPSRGRSTSTSLSTDPLIYSDDGYESRRTDKPIDLEAVESFLDLAYPPDHPRIGLESKWLFTPKAVWPDNLKPFTYRYGLENFPLILQRRGKELRDFVVALKTQTQIHNILLEDREETRIADKAYKFLSDWVRKWKGGQYIFFQEAGPESNGQVTIHPVLHEAWVKRRTEWWPRSLELLSSSSRGRRAGYISVNNGVKRSYGETFADTHTQGSTRSDSSKRIHMDGEGSNQRKVSEVAHRARVEAASRDLSFSPESSFRRRGHSSQAPARVEDHTLQRAPIGDSRNTLSRDRTIVVDDFDLPRLHKSFREPSSFDFMGQNRVSSTPEDFTKLLDSEPEDFRARQPSFGSSHPFRPMSTVQGQASEHRDRNQTSPRLSFVSPTPSGPSAPSQDNYNQTSHAIDQTSQKPVLQLIAERGFGSLDVKNPINWPEARKDTLEAFLARVLGRRLRHKSPESLLRMKLTQRWGGKETFVVERGTSEEVWKETKLTIKDNFVFASEAQPSAKLFKIWISCEFQQASGEDDEDDEDGY